MTARVLRWGLVFAAAVVSACALDPRPEDPGLKGVGGPRPGEDIGTGSESPDQEGNLDASAPPTSGSGGTAGYYDPSTDVESGAVDGGASDSGAGHEDGAPPDAQPLVADAPGH